MERRWPYLILIHFTLTILSIGSAPTTEVAYTHDTFSGLSENKSQVDMTHIPSTDHPDDATPRNLSSRPTQRSAGRVQRDPESDGKFAHETTTHSSGDAILTTEGGNGRASTSSYVSESSRVVENILTTILYGSSTDAGGADDGTASTEHPVVTTTEDGGRWKSTETYFINGLSDLLMENSGIDRIAEFVDEIANQHNSQLEKMDSSISTTDTTPSTTDPPVNTDPTTFSTTSDFTPIPVATNPSTESVEKIREQVTNSMAKNALNTEVHDGGGNTVESTTNFTPTEMGNHIAESTTEKNDSIVEDPRTERPPVTSTISQFIPQFDILAETGSSTNAPEGSLGSIHSPMGTSTKKPKGGKPKKKVPKTSVDTKKPFTLLKSTAAPLGDLVHSTTPNPSTTTTLADTSSSSTTTTSSSSSSTSTPSSSSSTITTTTGAYATEPRNEIQQTTEAAPSTAAAASPSEATTPKGRRGDWAGETGEDYVQPENEDDVLVVEIEDTDNFTEVPATRRVDAAKKDDEAPIEQTKPDMTDELFFPILVDRGGGTTTPPPPPPPKVAQDVPPTPPQNAVNRDKGDTPIDRDSDTFFYISNTEVKVLESVPTPDTHKEINFFPEIYEEDVFIDFSNKNHSHRGMASDKLEEDIILSPLNFDPMPKTMQKHPYNDYGKLTNYNRNNNYASRDDATLEHNTSDESNLSISYIGESFIEIKESTTEMDSNNLISPLNSDVIIQPVAMPEVPFGIGVPIIGELPPQIELMPPADVPHEHQLHHDFDIDLRDTSHVFAHPGDYLVKNPSISAEVPILESSTASPIKRNGSQAATGQTPFVDDGDLDTSMSDLQTLFTACLATLTLLMVVLVIVFGVRYLWRKYRPDQLAVNGLIADSSTDPLAIKSRTLSTDEDISRDARETKMHYSPSEKDGVFVVEVARGADSTGLAEEFSKNSEDILQKSNIEFTGPGVDQEPLIKIKTDVSDHQEVQIHDPPPPEKTPSDGDDGKNEKLLNHSKTGLTQSVLSMSSSNGSNKDYCYGSQEAYTVDSKGYKGSSPRYGKNDGRNDPETASNSEEGEQTFINRKPIVTGAIYKQDTLDFESSIPLDTNDVSPGKVVKGDGGMKMEKKHEMGNGVIDGEANEETSKDGGEPIVNGEAEKESFIYPEPPTSEEIKCLSDTTIIENNMDSLPPPPPIDNPVNQADEQLVVSES
ncbi:uncharacterized protein LOC129789576 isoform X2 [Lutzomyia longipalpis]|uniref:uncharacterized protein LOC129789576 isoform X2 n=1 Tax=Lutzomyia longipalpis TaxID=7200 RepID=UPI0024838379|nr:uncharacterized protein LOC129789576 isoform X2 [Lutzomyia longipalpis]